MKKSIALSALSASSALLVSASFLMGAPAVLAAPKAPKAATQTAGTLKIFTDWAVGCDNEKACQANGMMQVDQDPTIWVAPSVTRAGGADAGAVLRLVMTDGWPDTFPPRGAVRFMTDDGTPLAIRPMEAGAEGNQQGWTVALDAGLAAQLRNAKEIWLQGDDGRTHAKASLAGLNAALVYMDDEQGRADGVTALVATGPKPASTVPAPRPAPRYKRAAASSAAAYQPSEAEWDALAARAGCEKPDTSAGPDHYERNSYRLDAKTSLLAIGCGAGAYNVADAYYLARGKAGAMRFIPAPFDQGLGELKAGGDAPVLVNSGYDAATGLITHDNKGRGMGDCGTKASWLWDGTRFRLTRLAKMDECRGVRDWPSLWTAGY